MGDVSGAHINPAVTAALAVTRNIDPKKAVFYVASQIVGGLVGGGLLRLSVGEAAYKSGIGLSPIIEPAGGFVLEFMGTTVLIFVVFNVAVWTGNVQDGDFGGTVISSLAPIPIGLAVMVAHLTLGPFTGCGINPARVLGAVVYEKDFWDSRAGEHFCWLSRSNPVRDLSRADADSVSAFAAHSVLSAFALAGIYWVGPFLASIVAPCTYLVMEGTMHPGSAGHAKPPSGTVSAKVQDSSTPVQPF